MYLMFFIGGLFLYKSIEKKGTFTFIKDRVYLLFFPFIFGGTLLMLIAYFPHTMLRTIVQILSVTLEIFLQRKNGQLARHGLFGFCSFTTLFLHFHILYYGIYIRDLL